MKYFNSNDDLEEYIVDEFYGSDEIKYPRLSFAVVLT